MNEPAPSSSRVAATLSLVLSLLGAALSVVLLREHLTVLEGDVAGGLFCADAGRFDCNAVAAHPSAWWLGYPLPLWGLLYYLAMAALAACVLLLPPSERAAAAALGVVMALSAVLFDVYLGTVMVTRIGSICLNCVSTYVLNVGLALAFWRLDRGTRHSPDWRALVTAWRPIVARAAPAPPEVAPAVAPAANPAPASGTGDRGMLRLAPGGAKLAVALACVAAGVVAFVLTARPVAQTLADAREEAVEFLTRYANEPQIDMARFADLPAEGPTDARLTIVVAGDFECSFCRALSGHLESLRARYPRDIRIVFLNAPISSRCNPAVRRDVHPHACWLATAAICAAEHGKFWAYHDLVYRDIPLARVEPAAVRARIAGIGIPAEGLDRCAASADADSALARQVRLYRELGMKGVPSLVINGHMKTAGIYPATLRAIVNALLEQRS